MSERPTYAIKETAQIISLEAARRTRERIRREAEAATITAENRNLSQAWSR